MKKLFLIICAVLMTAALAAGCGSGQAQGTPAAEAKSNFDVSRPINVISREAGSGTRGAFIELFGIAVKNDDGTTMDKTTEEAVVTSKTDVMMTSIAGDPYAIGYISLGSLNNMVKAVKIDGVEASAANVKNGSYAISRPFNIATKGAPTGLAKDFIDFILSADGQAVVAKGYIPIDENAAPYAGNKPEGKLTIAGSSSVTPVMEKLVEAYKAINPNANIEIQMSDSTTGMTSAIDGICDIGMASRELKDSEKEKLQSLQIALDGIAVIVNNANPVESLSKEQVKSVFTGESSIWSEIEQ